MLLYLAQENDWAFVSNVFNGAKPEGITTPHGARKALNELEYVEIVDCGTPARPTYQCRLIPTLTTLQKLIATLKHDTQAQHDLLRSHYYHSLIPKIIEEFKSAIPRVYPNTTAGRPDPRWRDYAPEGAGAAMIAFDAEASESLRHALLNSQLALSFVLKFVASDEDERFDLLARVERGLKHLKMDKSEITDVYAAVWLQQGREGKSTFADVFTLLEYIDDFISDLR